MGWWSSSLPLCSVFVNCNWAKVLIPLSQSGWLFIRSSDHKEGGGEQLDQQHRPDYCSTSSFPPSAVTLGELNGGDHPVYENKLIYQLIIVILLPLNALNWLLLWSTDLFNRIFSTTSNISTRLTGEFGRKFTILLDNQKAVKETHTVHTLALRVED